MVILSQFGQFLAIFSKFSLTDFFSKMHGKVPIEFEKPTDIVAMLRHFFRVTAVKEGCATPLFFTKKRHLEKKFPGEFFPPYFSGNL